MKRRFLLLGLSLLATVSASGVARAETLLEKVLTVVIADRFGLDTREVVEIRRDSRVSFPDLGGLLSGSYQMNAQAREVARLRKQGLGWGQIAQRIGMHPGQFNKLRNAGAFDNTRSWTGALSQRFGVKEDEVARVVRSAGKLEDVVASVIIAKATGKSPQTVYDAYKSVQDWSRMETRFKVDLDHWDRYDVAPKLPSRVAGDDVPEPSKPGKGNSGGKGKGKGKGGG